MKKDNRTGSRPNRKKEQAQKRYTVGLDLGDRQSRYCVLDEEGEILSRGSVATTTSGLQVLRSYAGNVVALEAGTHSGWVSRSLAGMGLEPVVANPRKVRLIAESSQKGDDQDAETLARLARADRKLLHEVRLRGVEAQQDLTMIQIGRAHV